MIYQRHAAQGFDFFSNSRTFDASPYDAVGGLPIVASGNPHQVDEYGGVHIIQESEEFRVYPDPSFFGSAPANELWASFSHGSSVNSSGTCTYNQEGQCVIKLYDYDKTNYVFLRLTSTNNSLPVVECGANTETQLSKVFLGLANNALSTPSDYCEFGIRAPDGDWVQFAIGVVDTFWYVNYRDNQGWSYVLSLPSGWKGGRLIGGVVSTGSFAPYSCRMRTAAFNWGPPGYKQSGLSVDQLSLSYLANRRAANGAIKPLEDPVRHLSYGNVSIEEKAEAALAAIPFGFHGANVTNHFASIGKNQASVELLTNGGFPIGDTQVTSGQTSANFVTDGYTAQDAYAEISFTGERNTDIYSPPTVGEISNYYVSQAAAQQGLDSHYAQQVTNINNSVMQYNFTYRIYLTTEYLSTADPEPTFDEKQAANITGAGASAARLADRNLSLTFKGRVFSAARLRCGVVLEGYAIENFERQFYNKTGPTFDSATRRWVLIWAAPTSPPFIDAQVSQAYPSLEFHGFEGKHFAFVNDGAFMSFVNVDAADLASSQPLQVLLSSFMRITFT